VTAEMVRRCAAETGIEGAARDVFELVALSEPFTEFLTIPAYERLA
jgi:hypothetical protein